MVGMREINRDMVRELVDNHILLLYLWVKREGKIQLTLSNKEANRYIAHTLREAQYTREQIRLALGITEKQVIKLLGRKISKRFKQAIALISNPLILKQKSDTYAFKYTITPKMVERMIIEDLAQAGWAATQIRYATGFNLRTIQRIRKEKGVSSER